MAEILSVLKHDTQPSVSTTRGDIGQRGELLAAEYLTAQGYRLVLSNFKVPIGRNSRGASVTGEIDIIAIDGDTLCFVEVKTKTSDAFTEPLASVTTRKQRQITRTARVYQRIFGLSSMPRRFDVVSVLLERGAPPKIDLTQSFWSESKFRKKTWTGDIY